VLQQIKDEVEKADKQLLEVVQIHQHDVDNQQTKMHDPLRVFWFCTSVIFIYGLFIVFAYFMLMTNIMFKALVIVRGIDYKFPFITKTEEIIDSLDLNFDFLSVLLYPFVLLLQALSKINIDLDSVNVTCKGAQAPLEYLLNTLITCVLVIFIDSGVHWTQSLALSTNQSFIETVLTYDINLSFWLKLRTLFVAGIFKLILGVDPILKLLQLGAGLFRISEFFKASGIGHESTPSCDQIAGAEGDFVNHLFMCVLPYSSLSTNSFLMKSFFAL